MRRLLAAVERIDQCSIFLADLAPAQLACARKLAVVGVEFLVQDKEPVDLRAGDFRLQRDLGIDLFDALPDQVVDQIL